MKPRALDLFCGAGGATRGLQLAGFHVTGVDSKPQPRYVGDAFHQADAMTFPLEGFDFIWASPPCQHASTLRHFHKKRDYPALIEATRDRLVAASHYVIENVIGAELRRGSIILCGSMFGLGAVCADGIFHQLRRHRVFESSVMLIAPGCHHVGRPVGVYGNGGGNASRSHRKGVNGFTGKSSERRAAMSIGWMNRYEISQAIPPAYSRYIAEQMMPHVLANASNAPTSSGRSLT